MNRISKDQRIRLYCQKTFGGILEFITLTLVLYAMVCIGIINVFKINFDFIKFIVVFLLTFIGFIILKAIFKINNLCYL